MANAKEMTLAQIIAAMSAHVESAADVTELAAARDGLTQIQEAIQAKAKEHVEAELAKIAAEETAQKESAAKRRAEIMALGGVTVGKKRGRKSQAEKLAEAAAGATEGASA